MSHRTITDQLLSGPWHHEVRWTLQTNVCDICMIRFGQLTPLQYLGVYQYPSYTVQIYCSYILVHSLVHVHAFNTPFSAVQGWKARHKKKGTVCGVMVFFMLTPSCICNMSIDIVIWYDKCVRYHTNHSSSITCQKWDIRNCFIFRTVLPTTSLAHWGRWMLRTKAYGLRSGEAGCHGDLSYT